MGFFKRYNVFEANLFQILSKFIVISNQILNHLNFLKFKFHCHLRILHSHPR